MKKAIVAEKEKEQGYGVGIRQCRQCLHFDPHKRSHQLPYGLGSQMIPYNKCKLGGFIVENKGTCKKGEWK